MLDKTINGYTIKRKIGEGGMSEVWYAVSGTQTGQKLGTLLYMSPEQITDSKHVDFRTDLYSLAVTFVYLLSGRAPYDTGHSSEYIIMNRIVQTPLDLSAVPSGWRAFLQPYLAKNPHQRPALRMYPENGVIPEEVVADTGEEPLPEVVITPEIVFEDEQPAAAAPKRKVPVVVWIICGVVAAILCSSFYSCSLSGAGFRWTLVIQRCPPACPVRLFVNGK